MVDVALKDGGWVCRAQPHLADVLLPVHLREEDDEEEELSRRGGEEAERAAPVLLEQVGEGSPCILVIGCNASSSISRLLVVSQARTMEVYDQEGEYCGTARGTTDAGDRADGGPFYRKQLVLERPSPSCEVKLLSLGGRSSVLVCRIVLGLRSLQPFVARGPGIDLQQVQCLVEEMGTSLSPGAQSLMDMVQFQQKNQTSCVGGFLPLLMGGGAFSALARGAADFPGPRNQPQPLDSTTPDSISSADVSLPDQNGGAMSEGSTSPDLPDNAPPSTVSHTHLTEMMSQFLGGRGQGPSAELLHTLQRVCGQVTQLRLDDAMATAASEEKTRNGSWEVGVAMERRLEAMETRLREHMDRRLDVLEEKLEKLLLLLSQEAERRPEGEGRQGPQPARTPAP